MRHTFAVFCRQQIIMCRPYGRLVFIFASLSFCLCCVGGFRSHRVCWRISYFQFRSHHRSTAVAAIIEEGGFTCFTTRCLTSRRSQSPLALAVPLSRFASRVGGGSAFYVRRLDAL